jgi:hypothetical protein
VRVGATYGSAFAYVADGKNGLRVLQLLSPGEEIAATGFSPPPSPKLIATYATHGPALTLSKGLERDRAVDESGNQIAVFGRLGARPFNREEMERLFLRSGKLFTVAQSAPAKPQKFIRPIEPLAPGLMCPEPQGVQPLAPRQERLLPGRM